MDDRRGIANMADAAVFLIIMAAVGAMIFVAPVPQPQVPDAESAHGILVSTELRIDRVSPEGYGVLPLHDMLLLSHMRGGEAWNRSLALTESLLHELTPPGHQASWAIACAGHEVEAGCSAPGGTVSVRHVPSSALGEEAVLTLRISRA